MVVKLCLMASHVYPSGVVLHREQAVGRVIQDCQPLLPFHGTRHDIMRLGSLTSRPHVCEEPWKPLSRFSESNQHVKIDSTLKKPMVSDVQGSLLFSFEIAEKCIRHEKILQFLRSGVSEAERSVDISLLAELMGLEALKVDAHQQPSTLIYPSTELFAQKPLLNFVGDLVDPSRITVHPDGRVLFNGTGTEMKDLLSVVAEFYLAKNSSKWKKQSMLVPHFTRLYDSGVGVIIDGSSLTLQATTVAPSKSPEKAKVKSLPKKKNGKRERDLYKKNYFHACETLLSLMFDKKKRGKTTYLSLKKSGPELPELLTQLSAGIAGTGLAVLFSVVCKVASGRAPFCTSKLFSTGFGFGLVWLSWAVNKLRDSTVYISKNGGKVGLKEDEMMQRVDSSVKEIYFRAATLMAMAMLRLA